MAFSVLSLRRNQGISGSGKSRPQITKFGAARGEKNDSGPGKLPVWRGCVRGRGSIRCLPELPLLALPKGERDRACLRADRQGRGTALAARRSVSGAI